MNKRSGHKHTSNATGFTSQEGSSRGARRTKPDSCDMTSCAKNPCSRFAMLYESGDGKLCLFETHDGHLHAVNARRFC